MTDVLVVPVDAVQREDALDIARSVIVQAPAGSGKTDLLTRRFLKLLAVVQEPEEILAITFTRAATAEMRARILNDLDAAAGRREGRPGEHDRIALARAALAQSERRGWDILNNPQRLSLETIDSLCLRIAVDRPLLSCLGGKLQPTERADPLYALAARRTFERLGGSDAELNAALNHLLDLRDNRLADCEVLIAKMLARRDQWQHVLPLSRGMTEDDWDRARSRLEEPFRREVNRVLGEAHRLLNERPEVGLQLLRLANYAASQGNPAVAILAGVQELSTAMPPEHWKCLCNFVIREGEWRKAVDKRHGFPSDTPEQKKLKGEMIALLRWFPSSPQLLDILCTAGSLPPTRYSDEQWTTLRRVLTVLRQAIAELRVVFAEENSVDFIEIAAAALEVLTEDPDRLAGLGATTRHLLIDEFQDTSRRQHELVTALLAAWDADSGEGMSRTVFLVGDPMQSIYLFRQAEVDIFTDVLDHGIGTDEIRVPCDRVQLSVNFRSHAGLTTPLNEFFRAIQDETPPAGSSSVRFAEATSFDTAVAEQAVRIYPQIIGSIAARATPDETREARRQEARTIVNILEQHLPLIEEARAHGDEYRVAVLVRARSHLTDLVPLLRERSIPFRAVEIDVLSERQELLDLRSLTRALLHPMDRIAWLAVLRAPWCGLTLADLHGLTGSDDPTCRNLSVPELIDRHRHLLSADGQQRLARTAAILSRALEMRWRQSESPSFSSWIERTWRTLGGPDCIDAAAKENAQVYFSLLDEVAPDGLAPLTPAFDAELDSLFAQPDPNVSERCGIQLMTIHKAKGLGFDVVIVPGLDRGSGKDDPPLICSLERRAPFDSSIDEFLVAPIGAKGDDKDPLYRWVSSQRKLRFDEERKRLFYVACTRARQELHLLGTATLSPKRLSEGAAGSLLEAAWPALGPEFTALAQRQATQTATVPANVISFPPPAPAAPAPGVLAELAAGAEPASRLPRRLPLDFAPSLSAPNVTVAGTNLLGQPDPPEFLRPQGSREARVIGSTVHALLQHLGPRLARIAPERLRTHAVSQLRAAALTGDALQSATEKVTHILLACAADPVCQWILAPHPEAQSEAAWSGFTRESRLRTLRADRVFRAGPAPLDEGSTCLWVIDYKTGSAPSSASSESRAAFLAAERIVYAPQLLSYARALRALHGADIPLRLGLYYPALAALDFWDPDGV